MQMNFRAYMIAAACVFAIACGKNNDNNDDNHHHHDDAGHNHADEDAGNNGQPDVGEDAGDEEDVATVGDVGDLEDTGGECVIANALEAAWPLHDQVSGSDITAEETDGVWTAEVDAAAGGAAGASSNPFIYLDLDGAAKVDVTDLDAITADTSWEIAFRRTAIFINGGDAGPGNVEIARLTGVDFDTVTVDDVPADGEFITEDLVNDDTCEIPTPATGVGNAVTVFENLNPDTTSQSWYNYGGNGGIGVHDDHVYIIRNTDQSKTYKFSFVAWASGVITVTWAEL